MKFFCLALVIYTHNQCDYKPLPALRTPLSISRKWRGDGGEAYGFAYACNPERRKFTPQYVKITEPAPSRPTQAILRPCQPAKIRICKYAAKMSQVIKAHVSFGSQPQ